MNMRNCAVGLVLALLSGFSFAVPYGYGDGIRFNMSTSNPIHLGSGNDAFLGYGFSVSGTDNVARGDGVDKETSLISRMNLNGGLRRDTGKNLYWAGASLRTGMHSRTSRADYTDGNILLAGALNRGGLHRARFELLHIYGHEAIGEGRLAASSAAPIDRWQQTRVRTNYHFGRSATPLGLDFFVEGSNREYLNNETDTAALEYVRADAGLVFSAAYSEKTKFLLGARLAGVEYDDAQSAAQRDSTIQRYFLGMRWLATAKTSGEIRIGQVQREIDSSGESETDLSWRVLIDWAPKTYSKFRLDSDIRLDESVFSQTAYVRNSTLTLSWNHKWSHAWSSNIFGRYRESAYRGGTAGRVDDTMQAGISLARKLGRKSSLSPSISYAVKESNQDEFDYQRLTFGLAMRVDF